MKTLAELAEYVDEAARTATEIPQISDTHPLSVEDAYAVQALSMQRRYARGEKRIGIKMGLTSRAKMIQVGVSDVTWGRLTDAMREEEGGVVSMSRFVHPRVEPEIAFLMKKPLSGKVSALEAMSAVEAVAPALEIIDSRYKAFKFDVGDVIADNSSSSGFVVGTWHSPEIDISNLGMVLSINGRPQEIGSSAAILGNPVRSLVSAARMVASAGEELKPGDIVLAGGATAAIPMEAGQSVLLEVENLGQIGFNIGD
ncbi:2-keto-4-pentenoate hydratase [Celeribacter ethanolicus]|uniref:4-oxalocrotonate decarboxylase n=1 Tax=Celeribacter ethanolicus TaxID=1758178 RepID=A0A291GC51_9RHOB|nr:fumarylacetoacetate hydrolase family protein [Celeribacter ethanolicus]ATG48133.1 4-oxalocrotonate decarboxylase [Celeribacter ethanolicus]TNE67700.1 MAG: 4-oxalocrotonate decarboxylase [Paracoccaceae bacterium]